MRRGSESEQAEHFLWLRTSVISYEYESEVCAVHSNFLISLPEPASSEVEGVEMTSFII